MGTVTPPGWCPPGISADSCRTLLYYMHTSCQGVAVTIHFWLTETVEHAS